MTRSPRIAPLEPPFADAVQETLDRWMPRNVPVPPLALFRTLATHPTLTDAMHPLGAFLLGKTPHLSRRDRELAILRTCARAGAAYEWGVHATAFAEAVGLSPLQVAHSATASADAFDERDRALVAAMDELHDTATLSDGTWSALCAHWDEAQRMELLALAGFYRLIAVFVNALAIPKEPWAAAMPTRD